MRLTMRLNYAIETTHKGMTSTGTVSAAKPAVALIASLGPFGIGGRESNTVFDATFTVATFDAKVTTLAPVRVPTVGDFPVVTARGVRAPAHDAYGVSSFHATADMVVDTTDVVGKVRVDGEGRFDGSTFHDGFLNALLAGSRLNLAGEAPFVGGPSVVGCGGIGVAFCGGRGGGL